MRQVFAVLAVGFVLLAACSDYEGTENPPPSDAGSDGGTGGRNDASPGDRSDAGADAGPSPSGPCKDAHAIVRPVRAYDATPPGGSGISCNHNAVLVPDGTSAGLDRGTTGEPATIGDQKVGGCVGVEFAEPIAFASLAIAAGPAAGTKCNGGTDCGGSGCGSGHTMIVFVGPSRDALTQLPTVNLGENIAEQSVPLTGAATTVVVVCRASWDKDRDDVLVDSIQGVCP